MSTADNHAMFVNHLFYCKLLLYNQELLGLRDSMSRIDCKKPSHLTSKFIFFSDKTSESEGQESHIFLKEPKRERKYSMYSIDGVNSRAFYGIYIYVWICVYVYIITLNNP